ncbi:MAG: outer membrane lipoprotein-sorting protein [Candidatus Aminicenantales bacterium]
MKKTVLFLSAPIFFLFLFLMFLPPVQSQVRAPEGAWILQKIDENAASGTKVILNDMVIHSRRDSRSIKAKSWIQGNEKAFTEYLEPPREKGIKMLKLGDQLWTYSPATDRTISISGHMLRQSVMGSDLSYEDMMEDPELHKLYEAAVIGEETLLERPCWVLELKARAEDVAYSLRKVWVDKERFVLLKEERYAKSGKLLKTLEVKSVIRIQNRWVQNSIVFKDMLKAGQGTEFHLLSIDFDTPIAEAIFSKAALRK